MSSSGRVPTSSRSAGRSLVCSTRNSSDSSSAATWNRRIRQRNTPTWPRSTCRSATPAARSALTMSAWISTSLSTPAWPYSSAPDLQRLARMHHAGRQGVQNAARVAQACDPRTVQQMRVDARHLRRDVRAHTQQAPRQLIDQLEGLADPGRGRCRSAATRGTRAAAASPARSRGPGTGRGRAGAAPRSAGPAPGRISSMYSGRSQRRMGQ